MKALIILPRFGARTANVPAINIDVIAWKRPTGLTLLKIHEEAVIAVENPTIPSITAGRSLKFILLVLIFLPLPSSTSCPEKAAAILVKAIAISGSARANPITERKSILPTSFSANPIAIIPVAIIKTVDIPSLIFLVSISPKNPGFFSSFFFDTSSVVDFPEETFLTLPSSLSFSSFSTFLSLLTLTVVGS